MADGRRSLTGPMDLSRQAWKAKYGVIGMAASESYWLGDGMNTAGLSAHVLYMPGHCTYQPPKNDGTDINALEGLAFILGTCATTAGDSSSRSHASGGRRPT